MTDRNGAGRKVTLLITAISAFVSPFMIAAVNIALPTISKEFSMSAVMLSWVATGFLWHLRHSLSPSGNSPTFSDVKRYS